MKLKNLKIRFWRPAHVKRIIADLVQKWGDNNAHFCQLARNGPIPILSGQEMVPTGQKPLLKDILCPIIMIVWEEQLVDPQIE